MARNGKKSPSDRRRHKIDNRFRGKSIWPKMVEITGRICLRCGETGCKITRDHIVPLKRGGANSILNVQPLCVECNQRKGIVMQTDYRTPALKQWVESMVRRNG